MEKDILHERIGWTVNFLRILAYFGGHFENIDFLALCIKIQLGIGLKSILQA